MVRFSLLFFTTIIFLGTYSLSFASYDSRVKQIDQFIQDKMRTIKSSEKLEIPEYKGDTLSFERLSKIRNLFDINHSLPFEKKKQVQSQQKKVVKLKPIVIPPQLQKIMETKPTNLQQYPINSFRFEGTVYQNNQKWGVVENPQEKQPIYIKPGELIGNSYGQVYNVTKEGIVVSEWKKNTNKRVWEKTQVVIH
ncbi:pilus assembly protein PilP [Francisella sp. LA112445]|uniref:pilus assembly protein PilP n=1 Tax=Francisella sp. LA112445 TaxID=1395624 RepID=UPI001788BF2D|nr:pilus assembly protein PilP [Francisella sp. LA112445]QIW10055.1 pilus assembly protein PilP [Francisella sp. LA112445]